MNTRLLSLVVTTALVLSSTVARAQATDPSEQVAAAYVLVLGRMPTAGEAAEMTKSKQTSIVDAVGQLEARLKTDPALARATVIQSYADAFGRRPSDAELGAHPAGNYTALMKEHVQVLAKDPTQYEQVIRRVYPLVVNRHAYPEEIQYWQKQGTLSFVVIVGSVEGWARRNQPGLMVTTGTPTIPPHSEFLTVVRLSSEASAAARAAVGLSAGTEAPKAAGTIIAAGAGKIESSGRMYLVIAGGPDLVD